MLQRFSMPNVLRDQIARTRGNLRLRNLLGELALEFGEALGLHGALRSAIGRIDPVTRKWEPAPPDPEAYRKATEPHERGALLVAAVFDAFLAIYEDRSADLVRIATSGTGVLPEGAIHPDLVARLAAEAAKAAAHVLRMCIRALDYCPPVDLTFGEYLRALITADFELAPRDERGYRVAFTEAFRRRGIFADGVRTMSPDALRWRSAAEDGYDELLKPILAELRAVGDALNYLGAERASRSERGGTRGDRRSARELLYEALKRERRAMKGRLGRFVARSTSREKLQYATGLDLRSGGARFEVSGLSFAAKLGEDGRIHRQIILGLTQSVQAQAAGGAPMRFEGGATIVADQDSARVLYFVGKNILSKSRQARQAGYVGRSRQSAIGTYFAPELLARAGLRFAMVHAAEEEGSNG
jgi:hypothetical protein